MLFSGKEQSCCRPQPSPPSMLMSCSKNWQQFHSQRKMMQKKKKERNKVKKKMTKRTRMPLLVRQLDFLHLEVHSQCSSTVVSLPPDLSFERYHLSQSFCHSDGASASVFETVGSGFPLANQHTGEILHRFRMALMSVFLSPSLPLLFSSLC